MGFYQWVQLGYMGARMETFWFTLTYWCTPSSGTVRFTPECTNVPQPRCTEVPNSSGLRYSVPGTPWFAEVRRAQVQWGEEAFLTPICDPSLHCIIPHIIPHHGTLYSNIDLCCTASPGGMQGSTQQCRKLKCSLFQKGNPSLSRRGTCWL